MIHKCQYCDKILPAGSKTEGVACTCDKNESLCELPEKVVCDGSICNFKFQVEYLELKLEELKSATSSEKEKLSKLKELNNHYRILGYGPKALETLIQNEGINIPGIMVSQDSKFTWDTADAELIVTVGLTFMRVNETLAKNWAAFLNEKSVKVNIKKELIQKTHDKLTKREKKVKEIKVGEAKEKGENGSIKLSPYEKIVLTRMKTFGMSQEDAEQSLKIMGMTGVARKIEI